MKPLTYPLEQMITIKKNRFDQAVKILEEKKNLLAKAQEVLKKATADRDEVFKHKTEKLNQFRAALDEGTTTDKIQQMKAYLKVVDGRLAEKEKKMAEEKKKVEQAQKQVDLATQDMYQKKKDLEKLEMHRAEWEKEVHYWTEQKEAVEHDEQGSATHTQKKREEERRNNE